MLNFFVDLSNPQELIMKYRLYKNIRTFNSRTSHEPQKYLNSEYSSNYPILYINLSLRFMCVKVEHVHRINFWGSTILFVHYKHYTGSFITSLFCKSVMYQRGLLMQYVCKTPQFTSSQCLLIESTAEMESK